MLCGNLFSDYVILINEGRNIEAYQLFVQIYFWESKEIAKALLSKNPSKAKEEKYNILVAYDLKYYEGVGYKKKVNSNDQIL